MQCIKTNYSRCFSQVVYNTEAHIRIMELLVLHGEWGVQLPEFASPPALPPRKVSRVTPAMLELEIPLDYPRSLAEAEWYWGDITRYVMADY